MRSLIAIVCLLLFVPACEPVAIPSSTQPAATPQPAPIRKGYDRQGDTIYLHMSTTDDDLAQMRDETGINKVFGGQGMSGAEGPLITDDGLANIANWHDLKMLHLGIYIVGPYRINQLTDAGLVHLRGLTNLESLNLDSHRITGPGLKNLSGMRNLRALSLDGAPLTNAGLVQLRSLTGLKSLHISGTAITSDGLENLVGMTDLEDLSIASTVPLDRGMKVVSRFQRLKKLVLVGEITDQGVAELAGLTELRELRLSVHLSDEGFKHLARLTNLEVLSLYGTSVTGEGLRHLQGLTRLKRLDLGRTALTDAGLQQLKHLPSLVALDVNWTTFGREGIEAIAALPHLESLKMYGCTMTSRDTAGHLVDGHDQFRKLKHWDTQGLQSPRRSIHPAEKAAPKIEWVRTSDPDKLVSHEPGKPNAENLVVEQTQPAVTIQRMGSIEKLLWSPDATWLASVCSVGTLAVHEVASGRLLAGNDWSRFQYRGHNLIAFPDGKRLADVEDGKVCVLEATTLARLDEFNVDERDTFGAVISPDGSTLALGVDHTSVLIWDIPKRQAIATLELKPVSNHDPDWISFLQFCGNGKYLATLGSNLKIWDLSTKTIQAVSFREMRDTPLGSTAKGDRLVVNQTRNFLTWSPENQQTDVIYAPALVPGGWVSAISPDLLLGASADRLDHIYIWDTRTGEILQKLKGKPHGDGSSILLRQLVFSTDGSLLAAGHEDGRIEIWRIRPNP